jgi:hypothetical protein
MVWLAGYEKMGEKENKGLIIDVQLINVQICR